MFEDCRFGAASVFKGVGKDGETVRVESTGWKASPIVGSLSDLADCACAQGGGDSYRMEWVAEDITEQLALRPSLKAHSGFKLVMSDVTTFADDFGDVFQNILGN